jgi:hypothetical protein
MEFCPVCMLRQALAGGVESGESSASEDAVKPTTPEQATQRFEHYELVNGTKANGPSSGCEAGQRELINIATADGFARRKAKTRNAKCVPSHLMICSVVPFQATFRRVNGFVDRARFFGA